MQTKTTLHNTQYNSYRHRGQGTYSMSIGQYLDIALTAVHYGIYCPGGNFDLYIIGRIQYDVYIVAKSVYSYSY